MVNLDPVNFLFTSVGSVTGRTWEGDFKVIPMLSYYQRALVSQDMRAFLGNPKEGEAVPTDLENAAYMLAQIKYRVLDAPEWFTKSGSLKDGFYDTNTMEALYQRVMKVEADWKENLTKKATAAQEKLASEPVKTPS